ncbi:hypothetical protein LJC59_00275 [Desulfovibrio sp. OttesenSCG-928-A18]|nr:hypothetical protein [Desulfovibrio sp. OttesenSCG-928-A18]
MTTKKKKKNDTVEVKTTTDTGMTQTVGSSGAVTVAYNSVRGITFALGDKRILIRGSSSHLVGKEKGIIPVGRYGYTRVAVDEWEAIKKEYGEMSIFKNGLIFAEKSSDRAEDRAMEQAELRHGLEPVNAETAKTEATDLSTVGV